VSTVSQLETKAPRQAAPSDGCRDCAGIGDFTRLRYFHGQPLGAADLRREQAYHLDKARLRNRLLHGWGIVCGLDVRVADQPDCDPGDPGYSTAQVVVMPGAALDCLGNEIVVRHPRPVRLSSLLAEAELERLHKQPATVYLTICFREVPADPMRPLLANGCDPAPACEYARVTETYQICASTTRPDPGPACEPCCGACGDQCLELVAITDFDPATPVREQQLEVRGRRRLALHELSEITEVNWVHGATYTRDDLNGLLDDGLEVRFSRPVQVASLRPGVVELTGVDAGGGRAATIYSIDGEFVGLPTSGLVDSFVYRRTTEETLQYGDRLIVTVRGDFIVDECCRAVDADHLGGGVPVSGSARYSPVEDPGGPPCPPRPSGEGVEGGEFVSWVYVQTRGEKP
jgi:hypothetical protein